MTVAGLGYGEAGVIAQTFRLNDGSGGNDILEGQAVSLVYGMGTAPNTGGKHPLCTRSGAADLKTIGVALEKFTKGPASASGEGSFGMVALMGIVKVRAAAAIAAGQKIGPDASGDWTNGVASSGEFAVTLEASSAAGDLIYAYVFDRAATGFGGA